MKRATIPLSVVLCVILSVVLSLSGCLTDSDEKLPEPKPVNTQLIESARIQGRTITFIVRCTIPEPCWRFARFENSVSRQSITTTVFAQRTTNGPCAQVLSSIEVPVAITVLSGGTYTFRFWQYGGETLDTTLAIP